MNKTARATTAGLGGLAAGVAVTFITLLICELWLPGADFPLFQRLAMLAWLAPPIITACVVAGAVIGTGNGKPKLVLLVAIGVVVIASLVAFIAVSSHEWTIL